MPIATALSFLALAGPASAAEWIVYASHPDNLQLIIEAAAPGDLLRIHPGEYSPIRIDKPLTLIAEDPALKPFIRSWELEDDDPFYGPSPHVPAITLQGSGGVVTLHGLETGGWIGGHINSFCPPSVVGGGFDEVRFVESTIRPPAWTGLTGVGLGAPAVSGTVADLVTVERSTFIATDTGADSIFVSLSSPSYSAISSGGSTVIVLDSYIEGGDTFTGNFSGWSCDDQALFESLVGSPAIEAQSLFSAGATLVGGSVPLYNPDLVCSAQGQQGPPFSGGLHVGWPAGLTSTGSPALGELFQLTVDLGPQPGLLAVGSWVTTPVELGSIGWLAVDLADPSLVLLPLGAGTTTLDWVVPWTPSLVGSTLAAQAFGFAVGLTRPVVLEVTVL